MITEIDIYTDSSGQHHYGIGVLIVEYKGLKSHREIKHTIKTNGDELRSNWGLKYARSKISDGELYGILRALELVENPNGAKINIYTDSLLSAQKIYGNPKSPFEKLAVEKIKQLLSNKNAEVMWIKGHCGNWGNEIVDELTKVAKYGDKYNPNFVPAHKRVTN